METSFCLANSRVCNTFPFSFHLTERPALAALRAKQVCSFGSGPRHPCYNVTQQLRGQCHHCLLCSRLSPRDSAPPAARCPQAIVCSFQGLLLMSPESVSLSAKFLLSVRTCKELEPQYKTKHLWAVTPSTVTTYKAPG